ncbi:hypothetical protein HPY42_02030 [Coprothermobacteraceae bacterium]|nr:hypothetical protein [Coprothermobacteraceae bacterium]
MKQVVKAVIVIGLVIGLLFGGLYLFGYYNQSVMTPQQIDWEHYFREIMKQVVGPGKATPFWSTH